MKFYILQATQLLTIVKPLDLFLKLMNLVFTTQTG